MGEVVSGSFDCGRSGLGPNLFEIWERGRVEKQSYCLGIIFLMEQPVLRVLYSPVFKSA